MVTIRHHDQPGEHGLQHEAPDREEVLGKSVQEDTRFMPDWIVRRDGADNERPDKDQPYIPLDIYNDDDDN